MTRGSLKQKFRTGVCGLLAMLLLTACADPQAFLPKPYRPANKGQNRMTAMVLTDHIVVQPIRGLDPEMSALVTEALIDALLQVEYIATTTSPAQKTSRLYGEYILGPGAGGMVRLTFLDPWGKTLEDFTVALESDIAHFDPSAYEARSLARDFARITAARLAKRQTTPVTVQKLLKPSPASRPQARPQPGPLASRERQLPRRAAGETIIVTAIFDAPKKGASSLRKAIDVSLRAAGFNVTARPDSETYRLQCTVGFSESRPGFSQLALSWELKSPDGKVLATIDQANEVPDDSLQSSWDDLAPLVTQGAVTGISNYFANRTGSP